MAAGSGASPGEYVVYGPRSYRELTRVLPYLVSAIIGSVVVWFVWRQLGQSFSGTFDWTPFDGTPFGGAWVFAGIVLIGLVRAGNRLVRRPVLLRVDYDGVHIGGVTVPWSSVGALVIWYPPREVGTYHVDLPAQVGVRLRTGAPLPDGMTSLITDPSDPSAIPEPLQSKLFDEPLDASAVLAVARRFAPPGVEFVERIGDDERALPR